MLPNRSQRPTAETVLDWQTRMRMAFIEGLGEADMKEVVKGLVNQAKAGDMAAIRMVLSYAVGTPSARGADSCEELPPAPIPKVISKALPRTPEKLTAFAKRAANGEALFHVEDARHGDGDLS